MPVDPRALIDHARHVTFLTGAGISTAAGIPDFRGPQGLWTRDPRQELISTLEYYLTDDDVRARAWRYRAESSVWDALPTAAHRAIAAFDTGQRRVQVVTQNTDGLHQLAGSRDVLEVHGNARTWRCEECRRTGEMVEMVRRVRAGEPDPRCPACGGIVRATTILFGEALDPAALDASVDAAVDADVLVAAGTSLTVQPVAGLVGWALGHGARVIIVNAEETAADDRAHAVLRGDLDIELPRLLGVAP